MKRNTQLYVAIAKAIRETRLFRLARGEGLAEYYGHHLISAIVDAIKECDPKFDAGAFRRACDPNSTFIDDYAAVDTARKLTAAEAKAELARRRA
jgi:hypothetical protein